jgi:hypothetical protein
MSCLIPTETEHGRLLQHEPNLQDVDLMGN